MFSYFQHCTIDSAVSVLNCECCSLRLQDLICVHSFEFGLSTCFKSACCCLFCYRMHLHMARTWALPKCSKCQSLCWHSALRLRRNNDCVKFACVSKRWCALGTWHITWKPRRDERETKARSPHRSRRCVTKIVCISFDAVLDQGCNNYYGRWPEFLQFENSFLQKFRSLETFRSFEILVEFWRFRVFLKYLEHFIRQNYSSPTASHTRFLSLFNRND